MHAMLLSSFLFFSRLAASQAKSILCRLKSFGARLKVLVVVVCAAPHLRCGQVSSIKLVPEWSKTLAASNQRCSSAVDYQIDFLFASV